MAVAAPRDRPVVVDPTCGGGALLLAAGRRLAAAGVPLAVVARDLLWGADLDPLAVAVTEAVIALWSGGTAPDPGHLWWQTRWTWAWAPGRPRLVPGSVRWSATRRSRASWVGRRLVTGPPRPPCGPGTARPSPPTRTRRPCSCSPVRASSRRGDGWRWCCPSRSWRHGTTRPVREALATTATLHELWVPEGQPFAARWSTCACPSSRSGPATGRRAGPTAWPRARGVPPAELDPAGVVGDLAATVASFREEYYAGAARAGGRCGGGCAARHERADRRRPLGVGDPDRPLRQAVLAPAGG